MLNTCQVCSDPRRSALSWPSISIGRGSLIIGQIRRRIKICSLHGLFNSEWRRKSERYLVGVQPITGEGKYVFPSPRSRQRPLSNVALLAALLRMGYEAGPLTVHGFRSTASTRSNEQGWRGDAIERQLGHGERDEVRAA